MSEKFKSISVIIVNYNTGKYVLECIHSLQLQKNIKLEVIVVDNASQDNSVDLIAKEFGSKIKLIQSEENIGFGRANNLAARLAKGEFLLILNPDTTIQSPLALFNLINFLEDHPKMGMAGPAVEEPRKGKYVLPRFRYPSSRHLKYTKTFKNLPGTIAWILGACMLVRRKLYQEISGFDPDYFLYGEDADICLRVRQKGYEIGYCADVHVTHVSGASEIGADSLEKWLRKRRGVFLFITKHFDRRDAIRFAKISILKSEFSMIWLELKDFLRSNQAGLLDKRHRLEATIIVANELIAHYEDSKMVY